MRTFRTCASSHQRHLINKLDPDIFIHTWEKTGSTTNYRYSNDAARSTVTYDILDQYYGPDDVVIEPFQNKFLRELDGVRVPDDLWESSSFAKGTLPMFYKVKKSNELRKQKQQDESIEYDIVINLRPDLYIEEPIPEAVLANPKLLWHRDRRPYHIDDQFVISCPENINYYTEIWGKLNEYFRTDLGENFNNYAAPENILAYHIYNSDIISRQLDIDAYLLRQGNFLKYKEDYDYIDKKRYLDAWLTILIEEGPVEAVRRAWEFAR
jgi:hypothetical protein